MDQRLRVDDDVDPLVGDGEEVVGLDRLEALVHQRRRVDRDPSAHPPGRVRERVGDADPGEVVAAAEGAAGGGQHQPLDRPRRLAVDQLEEGRVLGVDRQQARPGRLGQRHHQLAAEDQALLVGEGDVDPLAQRDDRRAQAGGADDRVEDEVGLGGERSARARPPRRPGPARSRRRGRARPRRRRPGRSTGTPCSRACSTVSSQPLPAARPTACSSGERPITSSACVPIDPVEPSMRTFFMPERGYGGGHLNRESARTIPQGGLRTRRCRRAP